MTKEQPQVKTDSLFSGTRFFIEASASLFKDVPSNPSVRHRPFVKELALVPAKEPLNREDGLYNKFLSIANARGIPIPLQNRAPYWMANTPYNVMEVIGTSVQFIDQHGSPLPKTTLPPPYDMEAFINTILQQPEPVTIDRQFEFLLDITGNNVVGAANLGMLATRYMSRFGDQRAYPSLVLCDKEFTPKTPDKEIYELMTKWNIKISRFESYHDPVKYNGRRDGTGDSYYFWTHFFAASVLGSSSVKAKFFERGNEIMIFAKDKIAGRGGIVSSHFESSLLGRNIGLALAEYA